MQHSQWNLAPWRHLHMLLFTWVSETLEKSSKQSYYFFNEIFLLKERIVQVQHTDPTINLNCKRFQDVLYIKKYDDVISHCIKTGISVVFWPIENLLK